MTQPSELDLAQLIAEFEASGLRELHVRRDGIEIYLSQDPAAAGIGGASAEVGAVAVGAAPAASQPASTTSTTPAPSANWPEGAVVVPAPYLGTFYRSPKPGAPAYVELGQAVQADSELCLVEVMKLFTAVRAGTAGTVHAVLAADGEMVSADQPLFVILPA